MSLHPRAGWSVSYRGVCQRPPATDGTRGAGHIGRPPLSSQCRLLVAAAPSDQAGCRRSPSSFTVPADNGPAIGLSAGAGPLSGVVSCHSRPKSKVSPTREDLVIVSTTFSAAFCRTPNVREPAVRPVLPTGFRIPQRTPTTTASSWSSGTMWITRRSNGSPSGATR